MTHSLAKKIDKIVSKLSSKHKDTKLNGNDQHDNYYYSEDLSKNPNEEFQHESILQRMKGHLGHIHASVKNEHQQYPEGIPPHNVIFNDLKDSPFKGK
jgi:hypothetical protein